MSDTGPLRPRIIVIEVAIVGVRLGPYVPLTPPPSPEIGEVVREGEAW